MLLSASGGSTPGDLLGSYNVGSDGEAADIAPAVGGNQTISIAPGFPTQTSQGGTLTPVTNAQNEVTGYEYLPPADFVGNDTLVYSIVDNGQSVGLGTGGNAFDDPQTTVVTVPITVTPVNDAPLFSGGDDVAVDEDAGTITVVDWMVGLSVGPPTANDEFNGTTNVPRQTLSLDLVVLSGGNLFTATGQPTATLTGDSATLQFRANDDANGTAIVEARLSDSGPDDSSNGDVNLVLHTFTISVAAINDPPTFTAGGPITVDEDSGAYSDTNPWATNISPGPAEEQTTQTITRFDVDVPSGLESLFAVAPAISVDGFLTFTVADDAAGDVNLSVTAVDSLGGTSAPVTLPITITEEDDSPIPMDDAVSTDEDTVLTILDSELLANDVDPDLATNPNEELTVILNAAFVTSLGALATYDSTTGEITYDPTTSDTLKAMGPNETLIDTFTYSVVDANGETPAPSAEVSITVTGRNDAPDLMDDNYSISPDGSADLTPLDNDTDADGSIDPATIIITTQPQHGALVVEDDGTVTFTAEVGYRGLDQFQYTVADDTGQQSQQATVFLRVGLAPEAVDDASGTSQDVAVDIDVLENDLGVPTIPTVRVTTDPSNGTAEVLSDGRIRYTPDTGYLGPDSLEYTVEDAAGFVSNSATVNLTVVESRLQNPVMFMDVNASGEVTALDALLIINHLASDPGNTGSIPVTASDQGPNFYDVNGDEVITALDALLVINEVNRTQNGGSGEGESVTTLSAVVEAPTPAIIHRGTPNEIETIESVTDKIVSASTLSPVDMALIDTIVEESESDDDDDNTDAIDEALIGLLD